MATTTPNFGWPVPTSTDLVKDGATAIEALGDSIDASLLDLKGGTTGQVLSKTTSTDMDFTWVTSDDANAIQNSIVDARGDLISATANDTPARLAVGSNGETLVADSSTSTGLRYTAGNPIPNPIINSSFQIWQRGTSFTGITASQATADRWFINPGVSGGSGAVTRQTTSDTTNLPFIQYCARYQRTAGSTNTNAFYLVNSFETINTIPFVGKTVTLSFYARSGANFSGSTLTGAIWTGTGTDQNLILSGYTGQAVPITSNFTITSTWQRFSVTGAIPSSVTELSALFSFTPSGTAGVNDYFEITGTQIDISSVALPFRTNQPTFATELAACQRYYFRITGNSGGFIALQQDAVSRGTATNDGLIKNPVPLRIIPTAAVEYGGTQYLETYYGSGGGKTITAITLDTPTSIYNTAVQLTTGTSFTAAARLTWYFANSTTAYIGVSAEL
jgi:hypothetical protein